MFYSYPADEDYHSDDIEQNNKTFPPEILSKPIIITASEGDSVTLPCEIKNKDSNAANLWSHNHNLTLFVDNDCFVGPKCENLLHNPNNNSLTIIKISDKFAGWYYCTIRNVYVKHYVGINVTVEIAITKKTIEVGDDLQLSCKVSGYPIPDVKWYRQKNLNSDKIHVANNSNILIRNVTEENSGIYTCSASNNENQIPVSKNINIKVVNGVAADKDIVFAEREKSTLCCIFDKVRKMKWWKDGKEFQRNYPYEIKDIKHKTCLEMTSVSEEDLGIYTCEVTRENGNPAKANINLNGAPEQPILESVNVDSMKNSVLTWKVKSFTSAISYTIRYKKTEENNDWKPYFNNDTDALQDTIVHTFTDLPNGSYDIELEIKNKYDNPVYSVHSPVQSAASNAVEVSFAMYKVEGYPYKPEMIHKEKVKPKYDLEDYIYDVESRSLENEADPEDIYAQFQQKEKDLILAAELGKALLEKNEELSRHNERLAEEYSQKLEISCQLENLCFLSWSSKRLTSKLKFCLLL
ncbi:hypothetical protein PGB90_002795 [Kerria lacca]